MEKPGPGIFFGATCALAVLIFLIWVVLWMVKPARGKLSAYLLGACAVLGCITVIGVLQPVFASSKAANTRSTRVRNIKTLALATIMYASEHEDRAPLAGNWQSAIAKFSSIGGNPEAPGLDAPYDYAFNKSMAGRDFNSLLEPAATVLIFQTASYQPNSCGGQELFAPGQPGGDIAYTDGHANYRQKRSIQEDKWNP